MSELQRQLARLKLADVVCAAYEGGGPSLIVDNLPLVLRAAGDDAVAEALREAGWRVSEAAYYSQAWVYVARSQWRPVTPESGAAQ